LHGAICAFNGLALTPLVRHGADYTLDLRVDKTKHEIIAVYDEMFINILRHYKCLPDVKALKFREIKYFYERLRYELRETTKPRPTK
jgi:hypothetical protein